MLNAILLTGIGMFGLFTVINTVIALRKFPNEDPRRSMTRLPTFPMIVRLVLLMVIFSLLLGLATSLSLLTAYQIVTTGIFAIMVVWQSVLARKYGWIGKK